MRLSRKLDTTGFQLQPRENATVKLYKVSINAAFKISLNSYEKRKYSTDQTRGGGINPASCLRQKTDQAIFRTARPPQHAFLSKLHLVPVPLHIAFSDRSVATMD